MSKDEREIHGKRFFDVREKLTEIVERVRSLANNIGADLTTVQHEDSFKKTLYTPFLFVVCGEVNAGKSALINALMGHDLCPTNVLPKTSKLEWFRWGEENKEVKVTNMLSEFYRNIPYLKDFNIVDTPGTNSIVKGHNAITEQFVPVADLALFTFPINNPWGAATWDFVARYKDPLKGKMALILQQKDLRNENEIDIVLKHLKALSKQRLGEELPIFPVSATQAMQGQTQDEFNLEIWKESGFNELESFISEIVASSPIRRSALKHMHTYGYETLNSIENSLEIQTRRISDKEAFLGKIEDEINQLAENTLENCNNRLTDMRDIFINEIRPSCSVLKKALSPWNTLLSLFKKNTTPAEVEYALVETVKNAVEKHSTKDSKAFHNICLEHWNQTTHKLVDNIKVSQEQLGGNPDLESVQRRFIWKLGRIARQTVLGLKLRGMLDIHMETRRLTIKRFIVATLLSLCAAGALGIFSINIGAFIALGLALIMFIAGIVDAKRTSNELVSWFQEKSRSSGASFMRSLSAEYAEGVNSFFTEYSEHFEGVRQIISEQKVVMKPALEQWNALYIELETIKSNL